MPNASVELVANIWPIMDRHTGIIQRFAARAYAMRAGDDELVATVLRGLARTDFHTAKQYPVPERVQMLRRGSKMCGATLPAGFNDYAAQIVDAALEDMADSCPDVVGFSMEGGVPEGVSLGLRFSMDPYLAVTHLVEFEDGSLVLGLDLQ